MNRIGLMRLNHQVIKHFLSTIAVFNCFKADFLEEISKSVHVMPVISGNYIVRQGDNDSNLYLLYGGRLSVLNGETKISEISPGIIFGEMSVISNESRKTSILALRDSIVFEFNRELLNRMFTNNYQFLLGLTEIAFKRVTLLPQSLLPQNNFQVLAIFHPPKKEIYQFLLEVINSNPSKKIICLQESDCFDNYKFSLEKAYKLLKLHEPENDFVILLANSNLTDWSKFCINQADTLFSFFYYKEDTTLTPVEEYIKKEGTNAHKSNYLVMLHDENTQIPSHMHFWLEPREVNTSFNIKMHNNKHRARLWRILTGQSNCLILSGGGARACAHFALLRVLEESNIPVDFIGGSSAGALIAFTYAKTGDWETAYQTFKERILKYRGLDVTIPIVAFAKGDRVNKGLIDSFGDLCIEDLWYNTFCVSTLFKTGQSYVHARGLAWRALRASLSIPGLFPPVTNEDGELLIDGSVSDNTPFKHIPFGFPNLNIILSTLDNRRKKNADFRNCEGNVSGLRYLLNKDLRANYPPILVTISGAFFNKPAIDYNEYAKKGLHIQEIRHQISYGIMDYKNIDKIFAEAYTELMRRNLF